MSTKPVKRKRRTIWVEFDAKNGCWMVHKPEIWQSKEMAVHSACAWAGARFRQTGDCFEVVVRTKGGNIGSGKGSRFSYGRDPRRSQG